MKTYSAKPCEVERKWYLIDAEGKTLGRLASAIANILRGKNKPEFTPNANCGDHVVIINTDKVVLTGKKMEQKYYRYHTGYAGGLKEVQYSTLLDTKSDFAVYTAVKGMLPKTRLGRKMLKHLRVYKDANHEHEAQKPELINLEGKR